MGGKDSVILKAQLHRAIRGCSYYCGLRFLRETDESVCVQNKHNKKPLTMDTSAREAMKDAAKCDKHCELQISANQ